MLEHPEIGWYARTGYPSTMQDADGDLDENYGCYCDEDAAYEERRDAAACPEV